MPKRKNFWESKQASSRKGKKEDSHWRGMISLSKSWIVCSTIFELFTLLTTIKRQIILKKTLCQTGLESCMQEDLLHRLRLPVPRSTITSSHLRRKLEHMPNFL